MRRISIPLADCAIFLHFLIGLMFASFVNEMIKNIYTTLTKGSLPVSPGIQFSRVPQNPGLLVFIDTAVKITQIPPGIYP